jgi:hypothetical protein
MDECASELKVSEQAEAASQSQHANDVLDRQTLSRLAKLSGLKTAPHASQRSVDPLFRLRKCTGFLHSANAARDDWRELAQPPVWRRCASARQIEKSPAVATKQWRPTRSNPSTNARRIWQ